ncbi:hypothetical protein NIES4071_36210 [Calothrix sp. NIES-4071]|nr:hypothetical protein NIES4071_36210 [Calothrix sp. NIES-4071]BAZ57940.1 hypothetical protein NIES4105_36140 [Calothrix sp. NIES-4105]
MATNRVKMRLSGTEQELQAWLNYLKLLQDKEHIKMYGDEKLYAGRSDNDTYRCYVEVDLLI